MQILFNSGINKSQAVYRANNLAFKSCKDVVVNKAARDIMAIKRPDISEEIKLAKDSGFWDQYVKDHIQESGDTDQNYWFATVIHYLEPSVTSNYIKQRDNIDFQLTQDQFSKIKDHYHIANLQRELTDNLYSNNDVMWHLLTIVKGDDYALPPSLKTIQESLRPFMDEIRQSSASTHRPK